MIILKKYMIPCPTKSILGIDCPGCGAQTAIFNFFKGDFVAGIIAYPPLIPVLIMLFFLLFHLKFEINNGARILKFMFIFNVLIISVNYFYKLFLL